jgi:hypothetical protein
MARRGLPYWLGNVSKFADIESTKLLKSGSTQARLLLGSAAITLEVPADGDGIADLSDRLQELAEALGRGAPLEQNPMLPHVSPRSRNDNGKKGDR